MLFRYFQESLNTDKWSGPKEKRKERKDKKREACHGSTDKDFIQKVFSSKYLQGVISYLKCC